MALSEIGYRLETQLSNKNLLIYIHFLPHFNHLPLFDEPCKGLKPSQGLSCPYFINAIFLVLTKPPALIW